MGSESIYEMRQAREMTGGRRDGDACFFQCSLKALQEQQCSAAVGRRLIEVRSSKESSVRHPLCLANKGDGCWAWQVHLVRDTSALDPLVKEYQDTLRALTDLAADYTAKRRRGRPVKPRRVWPWEGAVGGGA